MTVEELVKHFGSMNAAVKAIGLSRQCIYNWLVNGYIPHDRQLQFEELTKGDLKAENRLETLNRKKEIYPIYHYKCPESGLCRIKSITFRKNMQPCILYYKPDNPYKSFSSFDLDRLHVQYKGFKIVGRKLHKEK